MMSSSGKARCKVSEGILIIPIGFRLDCVYESNFVLFGDLVHAVLPSTTALNRPVGLAGDVAFLVSDLAILTIFVAGSTLSLLEAEIPELHFPCPLGALVRTHVQAKSSGQVSRRGVLEAPNISWPNVFVKIKILDSF